MHPRRRSARSASNDCWPVASCSSCRPPDRQPLHAPPRFAWRRAHFMHEQPHQAGLSTSVYYPSRAPERSIGTGQVVSRGRPLYRPYRSLGERSSRPSPSLSVMLVDRCSPRPTSDRSSRRGWSQPVEAIETSPASPIQPHERVLPLPTSAGLREIPAVPWLPLMADLAGWIAGM